MKLRYLFISVFIILAGILFFTNPDKEMHKTFIKEKFISIVNQKMDDELIKTEDPNIKFLANLSKNIFPSIGDKFITHVMDTHVRRKNYFVFSTVQILYKDQWSTVGLGIFNTMFLFPKVEEELQKVDIKKELYNLLQYNP
ncbi:MAG: DUF4359 domain-containing protein [Apibacter sp.]|nr:DUF4359 domain-containing protein [Apibacter sp.]